MATEHRLPDTVRPEKYSIELRPNLKAFSFEGSESIRIQVARPTKTIVLNAEGLEVREATVSSSKGGSLPATSIDFDSKREVLRLDFAESVPSGPATLRLSFSGTLNDELAGFYRSRYTMSDGKQGYMAATQFESTNARRAFPCWDEPAAKATCEVSLVVPDGMTGISNTPPLDEKDLGDGTRLVRFAETPRMSTYLLAFAIGPLDTIEGKDRRGTKLAVWALPDRIGPSRWALDDAIRILDYLNDYYGIPYPLEKLDHIALQDFAAGAMENWGAITYRERILLFDPATSSAQTRQTIVEVIAHETAHMWFGDLVTMAWWDDLWLNESFASWMGAKTTGALHPEWKMWTQFLEEDIVRGLALDGLKSSHPIEVPVRDPAEIREIFDDISYSKGASILRMLEQFLGEATFRRGIRDYLKAHAYGNARTEDLWRELPCRPHPVPLPLQRHPRALQGPNAVEGPRADRAGGAEEAGVLPHGEEDRIASPRTVPAIGRQGLDQGECRPVGILPRQLSAGGMGPAPTGRRSGRARDGGPEWAAERRPRSHAGRISARDDAPRPHGRLSRRGRRDRMAADRGVPP